MVECRWYDGYGVKREAFHETDLVPGRGVVLRKKFERIINTVPDHIRPGVPMPAMNDSRVLSCHHYKIIAVLRYAIAGLCQNHKKAGWESSGCSTRQNGNQSWLKTRTPPGARLHVVNLCFIVVLLFSTFAHRREVVVLEDAYISSQRNHLENVANAPR